MEDKAKCKLQKYTRIKSGIELQKLENFKGN